MRLTIETLSLKDIYPNVLNPRKHSETQIKQIASSIKELGFNNPIILDESNCILAGHGRYEASKFLQLKQVPVIHINDLTEAQKKAFLIADNQIASNSIWDDDLLKINLDMLSEQNFDLSVLGWENGIPEFEAMPDYSVLSDSETESQAYDIASDVKKSLQIEFDQEDIDRARELVNFWRNNTDNLGKFLINILLAAKENNK